MMLRFISKDKTTCFRALLWGIAWKTPSTRSLTLPSLFFSFSITLHFRISCPASPAFNYSQSPVFMVPQVKIEMESDCDLTDVDRYGRETDGETTL